MITIIPDLPCSAEIDLKTELPIIDRFRVIVEHVGSTIYEISHICNHNIPTFNNSGFYEGVHGSLIHDYMTVVADFTGAQSQLVTMTYNDGPDKETASVDFETCPDTIRLETYDEVIEWFLEERGIDLNMKIHLDPIPNPYTLFPDETVRLLSPEGCGCGFELSQARYLDVFEVANTFAERMYSTDKPILKDIVYLGNNSGMPEYTFAFDCEEELKVAA